MASWVEIANRVGVAVGTGTRITDPDDDRTLARTIRRVWDLQRRSAIREGSWNFSTKRARLAALTSSPEHTFDYEFQLPAGCLRLLEVNDEAADDRYQLEAGKILCNEAGPLDIRYAIDVEEPALWDASFAEAFALRVAWSIGTTIAGGSFDKSAAWNAYQDALAASKRVDALENPPLDNEESDWITARDLPAPASLSR